MKARNVLTALCAISIAVVLGAMFLNHRAHKNSGLAGVTTYQVRGQIISLDAPAKELRIAHEEIPNYMPAMVMPFSVKDTVLLKNLNAGDRVQFQLAVTEDDSWIASIAREQPAAHTPEDSTVATPETNEADRVQKGESMPDVALVDQDGRAIKLSDFRGKAVLVTFIYTRCPLPNFCPLMSKNFAELQKRLTKKLPNQFQMLSVTMDPAFDTPSVLKDYAGRYDADGENWRFGTGTPEQISEIATALGLQYQWENGLISHDLRTALIGPDGRIVHLWKSNVWTPFEVERLTVETIARSGDIAVR